MSKYLKMFVFFVIFPQFLIYLFIYGHASLSKM